MIIKKNIIFISILIPIITWANFDIENYKFFKEILSPKIENITCQKKLCPMYIEIDEELYTGSSLYLSDLKIIRDDGKEIPYMISEDKDIISHNIEDYEVDILSKKKINDKTEYVLDFGESGRFHNKLKINSKSKEYHRKVSIAGSNNISGPFKDLNLDKKSLESISLVPGNHDLFIEYKFNNFRYLKITIFKKDGDFALDGFVQIFDRVEIKKGDRRFREVKLEEVKDKDNLIYILDLEKAGIFVEKLNLYFSEWEFYRNYTVYSSNDIDGDLWKEISRGIIFKNSYEENLKVDVFDNKRYYKIILNKQKKDELRLVSANFESFVQKIYPTEEIDFGNHSYKIYYGSTGTVTNNYPEFIIPDEYSGILLGLSEQKNNLKFKKPLLSPKSNIFFRNWYYFLIFLIFLVVSWFIFKIINERKNKDFEEEDNEYVSKL